MYSYSSKYVKEYIEGAKPIFSIGEYWDTCNYRGTYLDYNQGTVFSTKVFLSLYFCVTFSVYLNFFPFKSHTDSHRQRIINWIDGTGQLSAAFDFTTKAILQVFLVTLNAYVTLLNDLQSLGCLSM